MAGQYYDNNGNVIDFYIIFNLPYDAAEDQIKSAFRALIKRYHPDTSESFRESNLGKIDLIIRGYRILADEDSRREYDRALFQSRDPRAGSFMVVPKKRIRYSASLGDLLRARLNPKNVRRKDILYNFGQDVEIFVTAIEAKKGAIAFVELPARMYCPLCRGDASECYMCGGLGRVGTSSQIEVRIPPHVDDTTFIDIDLLQMKPDRFTSFTAKSLRIKITVMEKKER